MKTSSPRVPRLPPADPRASRFIVLTGVSGAGKSQAIRALEDLGYFCVDNLPVLLLPTMAELTMHKEGSITKAAVVIDVREGAMLSRFPRLYRQLKRMRGLRPLLIFLDANDEALVRRYSETRRPHPLGRDRSTVEGIASERRLLAPIREMADEVIDTSSMTVHELRKVFMASPRGGPGAQGPLVTLLSFGFKHGVPPDADLVFDARFLPNPHFVPELKAQTGKNRPVVAFLKRFPDTEEFLQRLDSLLQFLLPRYANEGKSYVTVAIGCTGGRHRSVYLAETLRTRLAKLEGLRFRARHRDIALE
ncbi:MAG: RNase adapter RapZ [Vicinamibacterales bacterium]